MPKVEKRKRVVLTLKQKLDICRRLEKGENRKLIMQDFGIGLFTIYDIKAQAKQLRAFVKVTDTPKAAEHRHTLQQKRVVTLDKEEGDEDFEGFGAVRHKPVVSELIQMSGAAKLNVSDKALREWVVVDMKESVTLSLTDDEIIQSVLDEQHSKLTEADSEEEDDPKPRVSWQDTMKGLSVFIKFAEQCTYMNTHEVISLHCIQNEFLLQRGKNNRQRDIREYMKSGKPNAASQPPNLNTATQNSSVDVSDDELHN
ncbi:hypothetical protein Pmani_008095 [Petrolisthes manimaculis]|uniref:HTH psq-type domain-containing protein n=1 Tax=Petrolisthes manimaculis TaxID=1843537 RepID=A0AAE1UEY5_9EUCA|nr:hypothetical protein Pmani_008095 [Petrolisthes manimaculis]